MEDEVREFLEGLAGHLVAEDYAAATTCLATWLSAEKGVDGLQRDLEAQKARTLENLGEEIGPPDGFDLDDNRLTADELREGRTPLPDAVTRENFAGWCCVTIQAGEGEFSWYDLWAAVVREDGELRIGYYSVEDPD